MRKLSVVFIVTSLSMVLVSAQQWSPEQEEVWDFIVKEGNLWCAGNGDAATIHPKSVYWGSANPVPLPRESDIKLYTAYRKLGGKCHETDSFPLTIVVEGDFAFVMYYVRNWSQAPGEDKPMYTSMRWLDVLKKENGKWYWFTGYGDADSD